MYKLTIYGSKEKVIFRDTLVEVLFEMKRHGFSSHIESIQHHFADARVWAVDIQGLFRLERV